MFPHRIRYEVLFAAITLVITGAAGAAQTYPDPGGSTDRSASGPEIDIDNVVISNDALNVNVQINLNASADIGTNYYGNYEIGIQTGTGAGGQTIINGTYGQNDPNAGNPYGNNVGISTGENFFIGAYLGDAAATYNGGAELFTYSSTAGWTKVGSTAPLTEVKTGSPSMSFSIPISALGLTTGNSFKFDVWSSFGSPQSAYDALSGSTYPTGYFPYSNGAGTPTPYDSAGSLSTYTIASFITGSVWTGASSGIWSDAGGANWTGAVPNAADQTANFVANGNNRYTVALDAGGDTVGTLTFDSATSYTIGSTAGPALSLSVSTGMAGIVVASGNHTIAAPLNLISDASITIGGSSTLTVASPIVAPARTIDKSGGGTLQIQNIQATLLDVMNGTTKVAQQTNANSAAGTSVLANLFVEAGGSIDLTNNALILTGGTTADVVRQMILSGRIATTLNSNGHALGYADNTTLGRTMFGGVSAPSSSVLIGYTFAGDANLDGKVNSLDFNSLATSFGSTGKFWVDGDFNYDGTVDSSDFTLLGQDFGLSMPAPATALGSVVPEPAIGLIAAVIPLWRRRRSRVKQ